MDKKQRYWVASKSSKVDPKSASNEVQSAKPRKSVTIKQKWNGFVESSTLHGLQHVFASRTPGRRIIWALFLLLGMGWFSFQSFKLLTKYFSYPVTTKVTLVYEDAPDFPAVSICNFNMFRRSVVNANGYGQLLKYVLRRSHGFDTSNDTVDTSKFDSFNMTELYLTMGHQIKDTLHRCTFNGEPCSYTNFTAVLTSMGLCHTFNAGRFVRLKLNISLLPTFSTDVFSMYKLLIQ